MVTGYDRLWGLLLSAAPVHADPPPAGVTGKVLVLDNQRILQGDIERQGNHYIIHLGTGQMTLPANQGLRLCDLGRGVRIHAVASQPARSR